MELNREDSVQLFNVYLSLLNVYADVIILITD